MSSVNLADQYKNVMTILEGTFRGRVVEATAGQSQNGNDQVKFKLQIEGGPNHGRTFLDNATATPAAMRMFFEKMNGLGLGESYFGQPTDQSPTLEQVARDIVGRPCDFTLEKDEYRGTVREKVKRITRVPEVPPLTKPGSGASVPPLSGPVPTGPAPTPGPAPSPAPAPGPAPAPAPAPKAAAPAGMTAPPEPPF